MRLRLNAYGLSCVCVAGFGSQEQKNSGTGMAKPKTSDTKSRRCRNCNGTLFVCVSFGRDKPGPCCNKCEHPEKDDK